MKWKDGPNSDAAIVGNAQIRSTVKRNFHAIGWQLVELPPDLGLRDGLKAYQELGTVVAVEPDGRMTIEPPPPVSTNSESRFFAAQASPPNDPSYGSQWYLRTIAAPAAWDITTGSSNVVVAILDTGVNYLHEDLAANVWRNPGETGLDVSGQDKATNGIDDDNNGYVDDVHGVDLKGNSGDPMDIGFWDPPNTPNPIYHGTVIAGIIGAVANNGRGIAGLNWSVQIMAVRIYGGDRSELEWLEALWSDILAAFDYVVMMKRRGVNIRVTNNSYGYQLESAAVRDAIVVAGDEGILSVCSGGNNSSNEDVFSALPRSFNLAPVISVAASQPSEALASFSNFGASTVDLAAPGVDMISTWTGSNYLGGNNGTSFACPLVVGAAALLLSVNPNLTVDELKAALFGSVDQPTPLRGKVITHGRLNVARALEYLTNANPPAIVITALPAGQRTSINAPIQITFSRPMNRATVESALLISPPINGTFEWTADSRSVSFHHDAPFDHTINYTVRILGTAQDDTGAPLDGNFDRTREGSPTDDFVWTFQFRIPNDDFANAQWLTGASGSVQASNRYASLELGEPRTLSGDWQKYGSSVWYQWTPPELGGWFTFDLTSGTAFDSLLAVYTGDRLDQLVAIAGNDNYGSRTNSHVSFAALAGTNYSVVVAGKHEYDPNQAGRFTLSWYPTPSPVISSFSPTSAYPGQKITLNGTNLTGAMRVLFNGAPAMFDHATNAAFLDLQLISTVPTEATTGPVTIETPHGNVATLSNFTVLARPSIVIRSLPGTNLVELFWPSTSGFNLQRADVLGPSAQWSAASTMSARLTNGIRIVTVTLAPTNRFFRLYRP